ncbi:hypothetical protein M422DRAFT_266550 [Sphaerobolus stellatus SS14]|uniref:Uncharacterized protein n=1 Tax=Sphaerobolus stellatus (strain SS14) TaxID=990650 RepID=A0A0C9V2Q4_SPHS4|nr:hypothetical protein M422DRAFT_266550 [Sphaerobolus stellatus SS14]
MAIPGAPAALDTYMLLLTSAIQKMIEQHVPQHKASPYSKCWCPPELTRLCKDYSRQDRAAFQSRGTIYEAKTEHWKKWLKNIDEHDIWNAGKITKNPLSDMGRTLIPTLHRKDINGDVISTCHTAEMKATVFADIFFPLKPDSLPPMPDDDLPPIKSLCPSLCHNFTRSSEGSNHQDPSKPQETTAFQI